MVRKFGFHLILVFVLATCSFSHAHPDHEEEKPRVKVSKEVLEAEVKALTQHLQAQMLSLLQSKKIEDVAQLSSETFLLQIKLERLADDIVALKIKELWPDKNESEREERLENMMHQLKPEELPGEENHE